VRKLLLFVLCLVSLFASAGDVRVGGAARYGVIGRSLTWASGINNDFILDNTSDGGVCFTLVNSDTSVHSLTVNIWVTSDLSQTSFQSDTPAVWVPASISPPLASGATQYSVPASNILQLYVNTSGAAHTVFSASGGAGSSTVAIFYAQTSGGCERTTNFAASSVQCNRSIAASYASATNQVIVTHVAGTQIYICGGLLTFSAAVSSATAGGLNYGTGTTCGTGLTGLWTWYEPSGESAPVQLVGGSMVLIVPYGQDLCYNTGSSGVNTQLALAFAQF
jgi:hypothetical protein